MERKDEARTLDIKLKKWYNTKNKSHLHVKSYVPYTQATSQ